MQPDEIAQPSLLDLFPELETEPEALSLLTGLSRQMRLYGRRERAARALLDRLGAPTHWESARLRTARRVLETHAEMAAKQEVAHPAILEQSIALCFGGQGTPWLRTLTAAAAKNGAGAALITAASDALARAYASLDLEARAALGSAPDFAAYARGAAAPSSPQRAALSLPGIFLAEMADYFDLFEAGFSGDALVQATRAASGHSQGLVAAVCAAEMGPALDRARAVEWCELLFRLGVAAERATRRAFGRDTGAPMAAVSGLFPDELETFLDDTEIDVALVHGPSRCVLSGPPEALRRLRQRIELSLGERAKLKKSGKAPGRVPSLEWEALEVNVPFHSRWLAAAVEEVAPFCAALRPRPFAFPVLVSGVPLEANAEIGLRLARAIVCEPLRHDRVAAAFAALASSVVDFGVGGETAKLLRAELRGRGIPVLAAGVETERAALTSRATTAQGAPARYADLAPHKNSSGELENRYTRFTGTPPFFLPGMTPTTVEADLVAAAANAGYVAELAGGGQPTEGILRRRLGELRERLAPGRGVVFNALYLDPYLWRLHYAADRLIVRLREEGFPLIGLTISAGIPPKDEAIEILRTLNAAGLWLNALKPGNDRQIGEVLAIADAVPELTLVVHIEGGKAGGHHSFEELDDLLYRHYHALRARPNVLVAVGGGIGDEARAASYLDGTWLRAYLAKHRCSDAARAEPWPLDAVFMGTLFMAAKEAATSPAVKQALVDCRGTEAWIGDGETQSGVSSGRSGLDAPIYYLDTKAARVSRMLDGLAGDPSAIALRKDEIAAALAKTAKPYFGDIESMSYQGALTRFVTLTATGRGGAYEDGAWPDRSYRQRVFDFTRAIEGSVAREPGESLLATLEALDEPQAFLRAFAERYPFAETLRVSSADAQAFIAICRKPGKPVCFVPTIDADVRRWFKSDSLWQSHDARYSADEVLAIPGPDAVRGIRRVNEPVAETFARFVAASAARAPEMPHAQPSILERALEIHDVVSAEGLWPNPLRRLLSLRKGEKLCWADDSVERRDGKGRRLVEARAELDGSITLATFGARPDGSEAALHWSLRLEGTTLTWDRRAHFASQAAFYREVLGFSGAHDGAVVVPSLEAYALAVGDDPAAAPLSAAFAIAWPSIFACLSGEAIDLLALLHEENGVSAGPAWPPSSGERLEVRARCTRHEHQGTRLRYVVATDIMRGEALVARIESRFFIRQGGAAAPASFAEESIEAELLLGDEGACAFLAAEPWLALRPGAKLVPGKRLTLSALERSAGDALELRGTLCDGATPLAEIAFEGAPQHNPVRAALRLLAPPRDAAEAARAIRRLPIQAPADMTLYAQASGDRNPIHVDPWLAHLGGLEAPIVHGMWLAAASLAKTTQSIPGRQARRARVRFVAPVSLGATLSLDVAQTGRKAGGETLELRLLQGNDAVLSADVELSAARTAYVFPGQGIQRPGMGMAGYERSAAARAVWEEADAICRSRLGFSLLTVVRENPRALALADGVVTHPKGVLFLTQFTQVAMAVMAVAQVAELEADGVLAGDAYFCGHSVGEYSALAAMTGALPLGELCALVYQRGLTMDRLVERLPDGSSRFAMGVLRPHAAGIDEAQALALVDDIAKKTGKFVEVVNYNVRGRQYAVTGERDALSALEAAVEALAPKKSDRETAYVEVPGIDVPFHSSRLRDGVERFRGALEAALPREIAYERLCGRYVPNLVALPFSLDRAFVAAVAEVSGSPRLSLVLERWQESAADEKALARLLLIELLAYQFASPVRWIQTQEWLFADARRLARLVEIGAGEQPTLANMARTTIKALGVKIEVMNSEAHREKLYGLAAETVASTTAAVSAAAPGAAAAAAPAAVSATATATATGNARVAEDATVAPLHALRAFVAVALKLGFDEVGKDATIETLCGGNSARRNQVLADLGAEFSVSGIDGAHEMRLEALAELLSGRVKGYRGPGRYLNATLDSALPKLGLDRAAVAKALSERLGFGPGLSGAALCLLPAFSRQGASSKGGALSSLPPPEGGSKQDALSWLEKLGRKVAELHGVALVSQGGASGGAVVDAAALQAAQGQMNELLSRTAELWLEHTGADPRAPYAVAPPGSAEQRQQIALPEAIFSVEKHVAFTSSWAWARRDVTALAHALARGESPARDALAQLERRLDDEAVTAARALAERAEARGDNSAAAILRGLAPMPALARSHAGPEFISAVLAEGLALEGRDDGTELPTYREALLQLSDSGMPLRGKTVLVTGAGPTGIAAACVRMLLGAGARVIATTSSYGRERLRFFRELYQTHAAPGAELHVVPMNQGAREDIDALCAWINSALVSDKAGTSTLAKEPWRVDWLLPFAAMPEIGDLAALDERAMEAFRVHVLGVYRLITQLAAGSERRIGVVLPLSPNHGAFGGDGLYAESKRSLEVLLEKWRSEQHVWGRRTSLIGACIGWVRGTGLMEQNDALAPAVERALGLRTFSRDEMATLLVGLLGCDPQSLGAQTWWLDAAGGFNRIPRFGERVREIRLELERTQRRDAKKEELAKKRDALLGLDAARTQITPRTRATARPPCPTEAELRAMPALDHLDLDRLVAVVGFGEVSPWGSARSRWAIEKSGTLSLEACVELSWMMGLIVPRDGGFADAQSGEAVDTLDIKERYEAHVLAHAGVRIVDAALQGFDPEGAPSMLELRLERDFEFPVPSRAVAEELRAADPERSLVLERDGAVTLLRKKGATIRLPRALRLDRQVAGQVPSGWDATRFGVPREWCEQVDRTTLYALISSAEAFLAAGMSPEEIGHYLHPRRVGCTLSSGLGGMNKLRRMYRDHYIGAERQNDALQETLINVVAGYVVQSYLGSYGPMAFPVAACATAAVSLAEGCDQILGGKADLVLVGGVDDYSCEGGVGFGDMGATASSDRLRAMGIDPRDSSRPNDRRRRGFVEAQGGGAQLICRASVALAAGLPVWGLIAHASSHGDGLQVSVPAPGEGVLAVAGPTGVPLETLAARREKIAEIARQRPKLRAMFGDAQSARIIDDAQRRYGHEFWREAGAAPLAGALAVFGLGADDVAFVSKHDTSTAMNDVNETRLHARLQRALGRSEGLPLLVVSQKSLLGHGKGAAAAWQLNGVLQAMGDGIIPGNACLEEVDSEMREAGTLCFSDKPIASAPGALRAALLTSLGFGHVGAIVCAVHPFFFWRCLSEAQRETYRERLDARMRAAERKLDRVLMGQEPVFTPRRRPADAPADNALLLAAHGARS